MTRRDRAAMQLALELVRGRQYVDALTVLDMLHCRSLLSARAIRDRLLNSYVRWTLEEPEFRSQMRLLFARLALLLRAMLRADQGDYGVPYCTCGTPMEGGYHFGIGDRSYGWAKSCTADEDHSLDMSPNYVRPRPLWELAPKHGGRA